MDQNEKNTVVTFILDESASMRPVYNQTVSGFDEYVQTLQADPTPTTLKLISFNSRRIHTLYDFEDIKTVTPLGRGDYLPMGMTPLYDSIARGILETEDFLEHSDEEFNVMFTIMTDGHENSSVYFNNADIARMIRERENKGWIFTFLGANQNAWSEGGKIGIQSKYASNYQYGNPKEAMKVMAESTVRAKGAWMRTRQARDFFTEEEQVRLRKSIRK